MIRGEGVLVFFTRQATHMKTPAKPQQPEPAPKRRFILEVCGETLADAVSAEISGADRIELCTALDLGGLTPSYGLVAETLLAVKLPIWVIIRPRPGDFVYSPYAVRVMARDIELFRKAGVAGFVFGVLEPDGKVSIPNCRRLLDACGDLPAVFHRAFDRTPSLSEALRNVIELGFKRILTSGRGETAADGAPIIARLRERAAGRIEILPCGKVLARNIESLLRATGCDQVHGSFPELVACTGEEGYRGYGNRTRVSRDQVTAARAELDRLAEVLTSPT